MIPALNAVLLAELVGLALLAALVLAAIVVRWRTTILARDRSSAEQGRELAIVFARHLYGRTTTAELRAAADGASADVFWSALEYFTERIASPEWAQLSDQLSHAARVGDERRHVEQGAGARRALAARRLGLLDVAWVRTPLRRALRVGPAQVTMAAALGLARLQDGPALQWLLEHPAATRRTSRKILVAILNRFGPGCAPILLRTVSKGRADELIAVAAIEVLGLWRSRSARSYIENALMVGGLEARVAAARALGGIGLDESARALGGALQDPAWEVRCQAALSLGWIGSTQSIPSLMEAAEDPAWWVRRHAAYALAMMGEAGRSGLIGITARSGDAYARDMAIEALQMLEWERENPGSLARVA